MEFTIGGKRYAGIAPEDLAPQVLMANFSLFGHPTWHRYRTPGLHLILVTDGRLWYRSAGGQRRTAKPGEIVVFYAGESLYGTDPGGPLAVYEAHVTAAAGDRQGAVPFLPGLGPIPERVEVRQDRARFYAAYERMSAALAAAGPTWRIESASAALELIHLVFAAALRRRPLPPREPDRWARLLARIESEPDIPRTDDLAKEMGMSVERFIREFRRYGRATPKQYVLQRRLWKARGLLLQGCLAKEAAARCGFADPLYFSRLFRRMYGYPPSRAAHIAEDRGGGIGLQEVAARACRHVFAPGVHPRIFACVSGNTETPPGMK